MRFTVKRTSGYSDERPPCPEAVAGTCVWVDRRTVDDPAKIPSSWGSPGFWFARGTNHRIEDGKIARDMGEEPCWYVDLPDLDALVAFVGRHGQVVIGERYGAPKGDALQIEIYDEYRE